MHEQTSVSLSELKDRLSDLRQRVMTLEWDKSHSQLNSSMEAKYIIMKAEYEELLKKVDGMKAEAKEQEAAESAKLEQAKATVQ